MTAELMREASQAVSAHGLPVSTVFAMHQGPMPWKKVIALLARATQASV